MVCLLVSTGGYKAYFVFYRVSYWSGLSKFIQIVTGTLSSSLATDTGGNAILVNSQGVRYYAYGAVRSGDPADLQTDRTLRWTQGTAYTGQEQDTTGLMYYHARFFDPALV